MNAEYHLLFGLLALQNGLIDQGQLVSAFRAWAREKRRSLADHLIESGDLDDEDRTAVEALIARNLKRHEDTVEKSLASLPADSGVRRELTTLDDPQIAATLQHLRPIAIESDPGRSVTCIQGAAPSDGQRFRVLRPHARGGLGEVFVALDQELHREVALKEILDSHADDPGSRHRFLLEAEITGGLEHPGVVPVYGLGTHADGRPYYAMRFIRGESFKEAIAAFHAQRTGGTEPTDLALRRLLRRFLDVCNAIDYAHSRGVLHRDIKPGNVILGKHGETLVVDWGLAKVMGKSDPGAHERTMVPSSFSAGNAQTLPGHAIGTPAYMSPEQAAGDLARLGPPSDVYSLGATLYSLLTGRTPYENNDIVAMLRAVQRGDFPPPRKLNPGIDKALEAICVKAMALQPAERYAGPKGIADDIERWLADEPVTAWREPWTRTLLRSLARHRTAVTAAGAAGLAALVGLGALATVQTRHRAALEAINIELRNANTREKERFNLAMDAIKLFHGNVSDDLLLKESQFAALRTKLLKGAADFYSRLEGLLKNQTDRGSRAALGKAYYELGLLTTHIGDETAALAVHRKALAVRRELASESEADLETRLDVVRSLNEVGSSQSATGDASGAKASFEEMLRLAQQAGNGGAHSESVEEEVAYAHNAIGLQRAGSGDTAGALAAYGRGLELWQKLADASVTNTQRQIQLAGTRNNIAVVLYGTGDLAGCREALLKAQVTWQKLAERNPTNTWFQRYLAMGHNNVGELMADMGDSAAAREQYARALDIRQKLVDTNPAITEFQRDLSVSYANLGELLSQSKDLAKAEEAYGAARDILQKLVEAKPNFREYRSKLSQSQARIGRLRYEAGDLAGAQAAYHQALTLRQEIAKANPGITGCQNDVVNSENDLADLLRKTYQPLEARAAYDRALAIAEPIARDNPRSTKCQIGLAYGLRGRGLACLDLGDFTNATTDTRRALEIYDRLPSRSGEDWFQTACCHAALANLAAKGGSASSVDTATAEADQTLELLQKAAGMGFSNPFRYHDESALEPLCKRGDFSKFLQDVGNPAKPSPPRD
jgi:serine/threonine-protein kinase